MTPSTDHEVPPPKLLGARSIKIRIALAGALLLVVGAWLAPRAAPTPLSAPQERTAPLLEEQVQQREVVRPFRGIQEAAARLKGRGVAVSAAPPAMLMNDYSATADHGQADGFGVFVSDVHVLTHADALTGRSSADIVTTDGRSLQAKAVAYEPTTGLVLLETAPSGVPIDSIFAGAPEPGTLAVAAGPSPQSDVAVPVFVTSIAANRYTIGGVTQAVLPGMPVYTLEGELLAVAAGNSRGDAYPVRDAVNRLTARASATERAVSFGIGLQELRGSLTRLFGEKGVLICHVVGRGPADRAGLQPGDVLLSVGEVEIDSIGTATDTLNARPLDTVTPMRVVRNRRDRRFDVTPARSYDVAALARADSDGSGSGIPARTLWPPSRLEQMVIPPTAWVLAINGRSVSSRSQAERDLLRARGPVSALLRHGDARFFVAIEPPQ